ncbi:MAG: NAD(P)-binding protein [Woeseiaceae bacterium]|nr:NAD(P)-binding protein [Woeseiaceae bacterium]
MKDKITRRDFLNGTQVAIGASLLTPWSEVFGAAGSPFALPSGYYPPALTGLRGSHDGSWETMHARVAGQRWPRQTPIEDYDLVVVGAGISGLSAAHFYLKDHPDARILVLDNHDDFGGHAKRNEFDADGGTRIGYGGTEAIDTPSAYTEVARQLLVDIGVDLQRFYDYFHQDLYSSMGLGHSILFDEETYGTRKLVTGYGSRDWEDFAADTPMSAEAKADLVRVFTEERDYLPDLSYDEKYELLSNISYLDFLRDHAKVDEQVLGIYRQWFRSFYGLGSKDVPAILVSDYGDGGGLPGLSHTMPRTGHRGDEPYIFHFPDGNASVARLIVRSLLPEAVPGGTMEDVVTSRVDYSMLDRDGARVRIRLNSTVVNVEHTEGAEAVDVTFVNGGDPYTVRADKCVLACYNSAIPYLAPELPDEQKQGLAYNVKVPLTYTKVLIRNWEPFVNLGISYVYFTNDFYKQIELDYPVSLGKYEFGTKPEDPMIVHLCNVPYFDDIEGPEQWRAGRRELLTTSFDKFEHHVRDQMDAALAAGGFDAERDIQAITVNRWPHGYSYNPKYLWEPEWPDEQSTPWFIGRQRYGRIAIANSDAGARSDTNSAITEAHRAVGDLKAI